MQYFKFILIAVVVTIFFSCKSNRISPIDITNSVKDSTLRALYIDYYTLTSYSVENKGTSIEINVNNGYLVVPDTSSYDGREVILKKIRIVVPSEHTLAGKQFPGELQLIHQDTAGKYFILSVFLETGSNNELFQTLLKHLPNDNKKDSVTDNLDLFNIVPQSPFYWTYNGSTTFEPIEPAKWFILKETIKLSDSQIKQLKLKLKPSESKTVKNDTIKIFEF